jgi:lipopolysaccharide export system permease protein
LVGGIFFRHVLRDVGVATLAVGGVLLFLLLTNQLAFVLGRAASGQIPAEWVWELLRLSLLENSIVIMPIAVLLGIVLGLGRLYHDSEIAAAQACGLGLKPLVQAAGLVILIAAALAAWIAFVSGPKAAERTLQIRAEALRTALTRSMTPGQFRALGDGAMLHFAALESDGSLRRVFVQQRLGDAVEVVVAESARYEISADNNFYTISLRNGESRAGIPGEGAWRRLQFAEQVLRVPTPEASIPGKPRTDVEPTARLIGATDPRKQAELQWRISSVVMLTALGLLAVPLSTLRPRQGRYTRVIWALLLYAVYTYLLIYGRTLLEKGDTPSALGLWWAHAVAIALGLALVLAPRFNDWRARQLASA